MDVSHYAKQHAFGYAYASTYVLSEDKDRHVFDDDIDVLWVIGWQRLVPAWVLAKIKVASIGVHGSPDGIMQGRGRSPQNWALLLGCPSFRLALFLLTAEMDDGALLLESDFAYHEGDTIVTSYKKAALCCGQMMIHLLSNPEKITQNAVEQKGESFYFPQRKASDAGIDWSQSCQSILNVCRAQTKPYPGAFTEQDGVKISIWSCQKLDANVTADNGRICHVFWDGHFLVQASDGRILVTDWEANDPSWQAVAQSQLSSASYAQQITTIVARHQKKHPSMALNARIQASIEMRKDHEQ